MFCQHESYETFFLETSEENGEDREPRAPTHSTEMLQDKVCRKNETKLTTNTVTQPCVLCLTDERQVAFIPCGHYIACVPCGHSLRTCAVCRESITSFIRVYV